MAIGTVLRVWYRYARTPPLMTAAPASSVRAIARATLAARAISESVFEAVYDGVRTADLQGHAMTNEFTDEVIKRVKTKLAVWPSLG